MHIHAHTRTHSLCHRHSTILAFDEKYWPISEGQRNKVAALHKRVSETKCERELMESGSTVLAELRAEVAQCVRELGYEME